MAEHWSDMSPDARELAVRAGRKENYSFSQIARKYQTTRGAVSGLHFRMRQQAKRKDLKGKKPPRDGYSQAMLDKAASFYMAGDSRQSIGRSLGIPERDIHRLIKQARESGDKRFNERYTRAPTFEVPRGPDGPTDLVTLYHAFRQERHPDGTSYDKDDVFTAHRGPEDGSFDPLALVRPSQ